MFVPLNLHFRHIVKQVMFYNVPSFPVSKAGQQGGSADEDVCVIKALLHTLFFLKSCLTNLTFILNDKI